MSEIFDQIDDYLSGRLGEEALDRFEESLLSSKELQREVKMRQAFREALASESSMLLERPPLTLLERIRELVTTPAWSYGATASVAILLAITLIGTDNEYPVGSVSVHHIEQTRSSSTLAVSASADQVLILSIDAFGLDMDSASVAVLDGETSLVTIDTVEADDQGLFNIVVGTFEAGQYRIVLTSPQGNTFDFPLSVE